MDILLRKRTILFLSLVSIGFYIAAYVIGVESISCQTSAATSNSMTCTAGPGGSLGAAGVIICALIAFCTMMVAWVTSLVKVGRIRHWIWFLFVFFLPPVSTLIYGAVGPELPPHHEAPTYIEDTPRHPVTS